MAQPQCSAIAPPWENPATRCAAADAAPALALDQAVEKLLRGADAGCVFPPAIERDDVVPGAHARAQVDRNRPDRSVRKYKAYRKAPGEPEFAHHRLEDGPVCAQPVQPDHRGIRFRDGFELDRLG